jgi:hypothetical protein
MRLQEQADQLYFTCLERPFIKWQKLGEGGRNKGPRLERRALHEQWRKRDDELNKKGNKSQTTRAATIACEFDEKIETVRDVLKPKRKLGS